MAEQIVSRDGLKVIRLSELMYFYNELGIDRFPPKNLHSRNFSEFIGQYSPQVQDPIISFSSKSLVLGLNNDQICKIRLDGKSEVEYENHTLIKSKTNLFPKLAGTIKFNNGDQGIIMERLKIMNKFNFSAGELNGMYFRFMDEIKKLHDHGIVHNDLGMDKTFNCRPNIVLTENEIKLIDCESILFQGLEKEWIMHQKNEMEELNNYFYELINFHCETLT